MLDWVVYNDCRKDLERLYRDKVRAIIANLPIEDRQEISQEFSNLDKTWKGREELAHKEAQADW